MVRLRYLGHNLEVPEGQFVIGRSSKCQLSIDDPLISRQHAVISVQGGLVEVQDLGSRNGVLLNGKRIKGSAVVTDGDTITVGSQAMTVHGVSADRAAHVPRTRVEMQTIQTTALAEIGDDPTDDTTIRPGPFKGAPDRNVNELSLVGAVAEKALALGRSDDAQRLLDRPLRDILARVRGGGQPVGDATLERAAGLSIKLAGALGRGEWIDFVLDLYSEKRLLLPQPVVDELYTLLRKVRCDSSKLSYYLELLRQGSDQSPNAKFQISRIEGLEPLVGLK